MDNFGGDKEVSGAVTATINNFSETCIRRSDREERFILSNADYRIKGWHVMKTRNQKVFGKLKAFTKNYIWKRGKYRKRRIDSSARIYGMVAEYSKPACEEINVPIDEFGEWRKKMRSKVKLKFNSQRTHGTGDQLSTVPMALFSAHNQRGEIFIMDFRQR